MDTIAIINKASLASIPLVCETERIQSCLKEAIVPKPSYGLAYASTGRAKNRSKCFYQSVASAQFHTLLRQSIPELEITIAKVSVNCGDKNSDLARLRQSMSLSTRSLSIEYCHPHEGY
jgi:hypothetical protein